MANMESHGLMPRVGHGSEHHDWLSRDWLDIDCKAIGCKYNRSEKCMVPSLCSIGDDGRCKGFVARETPKVIDGD